MGTAQVRRRATNLSKAVYGSVAFGALVAAAGTVFVLNERLAAFRTDALAQAVTVRARGVELDFARTLHQEWRKARIIAEDIARRDDVALRSSLDLVVGDNERVSWAGLAMLDGTVRVASGGLLVGQNVSSRPWFQQGLQGDFAGDVHDAVLLAKLLRTEDNEPRRFLDLATPVRDEAGQISGVLGLHLDQRWAEAHLTEAAEAVQIDVFVVNREGQIVLTTERSLSGSVDLASMRAATTGVSVAALEQWPDGRRYLTTVIPAIAYQDLPSFGWSMVARIDDGVVGGGISSLSGSVIAFLALFGVALAGLTALFVRIFVRPFSLLAETARAILAGQPVYPYETRATDEAAALSAALATLQNQQMNASGAGGTPPPAHELLKDKRRAISAARAP